MKMEKEKGKDIYRLDPRGLKPTVLQATFDPPNEEAALAYKPNLDIGEMDLPELYIEPLQSVVNTLTKTSQTWEDVSNNLPDI